MEKIESIIIVMIGIFLSIALIYILKNIVKITVWIYKLIKRTNFVKPKPKRIKGFKYTNGGLIFDTDGDLIAFFKNPREFAQYKQNKQVGQAIPDNFIYYK